METMTHAGVVTVKRYGIRHALTRTTDKAKQAIFARLAEQSAQLAADVEAVLAAKFRQGEQ